jgi:competence protein ComEC
MSTKTSYQPLPPIFVAAIAGILTDRLLEPPVILWTLLCFIFLITWFIVRKNPLILVAVFAFFGFWHHDHWSRFAENDIGCYVASDTEERQSPVPSQPAALIGTVGEMPRFYPKPPHQSGQIFETSAKTVFTFHAQQLRDGNDWIPVSGNVLTTIYDDCRNLNVGDRLQLFGELAQPIPAGNPGDYNYADYLRGLRIRALLRCSDSTAVTSLPGTRHSPGRWIASIRRAGVAHLERHLSDKTRPVAEAMIFGVRESVDNNVWQSMLDTGTVHVLSISGLHVTLVAGVAAWFLRRMRVSRRTTAIAMILFVLFYLLLTDVRTPAIRAVALICAFAIGLYANRPTPAKNLLCASALIVLLWHPSELFQFGAQLSFIAVGSFLWIPRYARLKLLFYRSNPTDEDLRTLNDIERIESASWHWLRRISRFFRWTAELFLISFVVWIFVTPLILSHIHLFTPVSVLVNPLLWLPLTAAMICGFATALVGQVPLIGDICGIGADWSFAALLEMIAWFQRLGGHYWMPGPPNWWNVLFYSVFIFFTFVPVRRPRGWILLTALIVWILIGFGAGCYRDMERRQSDRLTLTVLSTGHGNSVLITTPANRMIVCDVGSLTSPRYATDAMSRSIWRFGKMHIDALLISHPDNDHFNGVTLLMDRFSIGVVLISPYAAEVQNEFDRTAWSLLREKLESKNIPIRQIGDGDDLLAYGLPDSIILHPPKEGFAEPTNTNATSLVLRLEHHGVGILLPGDLDGREPSPFLLREPMPTKIVMVPHHGGRSLQTERLLEWAKPQTLIFSTGKLSHRPELLEQYRQKGYEVRSTFIEGAIVIDIGK